MSEKQLCPRCGGSGWISNGFDMPPDECPDCMEKPAPNPLRRHYDDLPGYDDDMVEFEVESDPIMTPIEKFVLLAIALIIVTFILYFVG